MTKSEYEDYQRRFAAGVDGLEYFSTGGCDECGKCDDGAETEPFFSWYACDVCGSRLGGDRHPAHYVDEGNLEHLDVCVDCRYYAEYGQLDDMTMLEIERDREEA